jgi:arylsulfatase A-like enzyme
MPAPDDIDNVLFVFTDQQRQDSLGCYGNEFVETPHVDRLAAEGVRFDNGYTPTAICTPARAALVSGEYPFKNGVTSNGGNWPQLLERDPYPALLRDAGYNVGLSGKWHLGTPPSEFGFDGPHIPTWHQVYDHDDYLAYLEENDLPPINTDEFEEVFPEGGEEYQSGAVDPRPVEASYPYYIAERAIEQLGEYVEEYDADDRPFYQSVHFFGPHNPYYLPQEYFDLYDYRDVDLPESAVKETFRDKPSHQRLLEDDALKEFPTDDWKRILAAYHGFVSLIDAQVGRLLDALEEFGVNEDTAVVFTADHGSYATAHKFLDKGATMYEDIYNVPFVARGLGREDEADDRFVSLLDLAPTFLDIADAPIPDAYDGRSLFELNDPNPDWREAITTEFHGHALPYEQRMIRMGDHKLVVNTAHTNELYDLTEDPDELVNLVDSCEHEEIRERLMAELSSRLEERGDGILPPQNISKLTQFDNVGLE